MKIKAKYGIHCGHSPTPGVWHSHYKTLEERFSCDSEKEGFDFVMDYAKEIIVNYPCDPNTRKTKISLVSLIHHDGRIIPFEFSKSEIELTAFERWQILAEPKN